LNIFDGKDIFHHILLFFKELFTSSLFLCSEEIFVHNSQKFFSILSLIEKTISNFYYRKNIPQEFTKILDLVYKINDYLKNFESVSFVKLEKNFFSIEDYEFIKELLYEKNNKLNSQNLLYTPLSSPEIFPSDFLKIVVSNPINNKLILLCLDNNYEIIEHVNFLLNNPKIHPKCFSIPFYSNVSSLINIRFYTNKQSLVCVYENKKF
jgi:hypothetical protein